MRTISGILLLCAALNAFAKGNRDTNSLDYAVVTGNIVQAKRILTAHPSLLSSEEGRGILTTAAIRGRGEMVEFLVSQGADVNEKGFYDMTPLACMAWAFPPTNGDKYPEIATFLIAHGAAVNAVDQYKKTPLMHAIECGNYRFTEALLKGGADQSRTFWGGGAPTTTLHYAITHATDGDVAILLKYHPPLDMEDGDRRTPLLLAELYEKTNIVSIIRELTHDTNTVPSSAEMRELGKHVAAGDFAALQQLIQIYAMFRNRAEFDHSRGPWYTSPWMSICSSRERAAIEVLQEEAGKGNTRAFEMARAHIKDNDQRLSEFSLSICSIAAAAGNADALDVLMNYQPPRGMGYNVYLREPAAANIGPAVDHLVNWLEHHPSARGDGDWLYVTDDLAKAAKKGNQHARDALVKLTDLKE